MDTNRVKKATEWFYKNVFRDEAIHPRTPVQTVKLPSLLRTARSLENAPNNPWQSREAIFLKQAKLLANYTDDYQYNGTVVRYFPTYQSLTDQELRAYFSWRTKLRNGEMEKTSMSFAFLYIYELLNQIGVDSPLDGFQKLKSFGDEYGQLDGGIQAYLSKWIIDYVIYYNLDANLLGDYPQVIFDRSITILDLVCEQSETKVMYAVKQLSPKWLARSKFYTANQSDCDAVIVRVLRKISDHYAKHTKKTMVEQFFGKLTQYQVRLFDSAVFCNPMKLQNCEFILDERCIYRCQNGLWTVTKHPTSPRASGKLDDVLKTIDAIMREEYAFKYPIKYETETKWLIKIIREEILSFLAEKKTAEAKKIHIDYTQLEKIRQEAAITQDKLTVEEELEKTEPIEPAQKPEIKDTAASDLAVISSPLSPPEYRLMQCLLYERNTDWVQTEGFMMSVLTDSINDKLHDVFMDTVLDDTPAPHEDYIVDLKEMVSP